MKYLCSVLFFALLLPLSVVHAEEQLAKKSNSKANIHKTCVYKYLDCKDNCDYIQDQTQILSCKTQCNRKFSCRPKRARLPGGNPLEQ